MTLINIPGATQDTFLRNSRTEILHSILDVLPSMFVDKAIKEKNSIIFPSNNADNKAKSMYHLSKTTTLISIIIY